MHHKELTSMALNIEFLVISVIQGLAIQMLAANVMPIFNESKFEYSFYAISGFILILIFWSQSIIHALSFIDWPIDLIHTFLYFLASIVEVIAFAYLTNPLRWFIFSFVFVCTTSVLYAYDFKMIKKHKKRIESNEGGRKVYEHIYKQQVTEMRYLVPSALVFYAAAVCLIYFNNTLFIDQKYHVVLASLQAVSSIVLLIVTVKSFKTRSRLITAALSERT